MTPTIGRGMCIISETNGIALCSYSAKLLMFGPERAPTQSEIEMSWRVPGGGYKPRAPGNRCLYFCTRVWVAGVYRQGKKSEELNGFRAPGSRTGIISNQDSPRQNERLLMC